MQDLQTCISQYKVFNYLAYYHDAFGFLNEIISGERKSSSLPSSRKQHQGFKYSSFGIAYKLLPMEEVSDSFVIV